MKWFNLMMAKFHYKQLRKYKYKIRMDKHLETYHKIMRGYDPYQKKNDIRNKKLVE